MSALDLPDYQDVLRARSVLAGAAHRTPVLRSSRADEIAGAQLFFKCENFQRSGAAKFRGAYYAVSRLSPAQRAAGVVAYSSGNHAQALALAASLLGTRATVLMPEDAPAAKRAATEEYGGTVITYDRYRDDRVAMAMALVRDRGLSLVPPYDHADVIAGQGTAAAELIEEVGELDALLAPVGGGGLLAGSALAVRAMRPSMRLIGIEPDVANDAQISLRNGLLHRIVSPQTLADGAATACLGDRNFTIMRREVDDIVTVSEDELRATFAFLVQRMKIIVEPTGCLGAAAMLHGRADLKGKRVGVILSGGNVDPAVMAALLTGKPVVRSVDQQRSAA